MFRCNAFLGRQLVLALAVSAQCCLLASAQDFAVDDVRAAWTKHADLINSIEYRVRQERKEKVYKPTPDDHIGPGAEEDAVSPVTLIGDLVFIKAQDRIAFLRNSEVWNSKERKTNNLRQQFCFDGVQNASYVEGLPTSVGQATPSKSPDDHVTSNLEVIPIWWAHFPLKQITDAGDFATNDLEIIDQGGDQQLVGLRLVSRGNKEHLYRFYADVTNGFRIVKLNMEHKGRKLLDVNIEYTTDELIGWKVASWDCTSVNGLHIKSTVAECKVNKEVLDDAFMISFPKGTYIVHSRTFQFLPEKFQKVKRD